MPQNLNELSYDLFMRCRLGLTEAKWDRRDEDDCSITNLNQNIWWSLSMDQTRVFVMFALNHLVSDQHVTQSELRH